MSFAKEAQNNDNVESWTTKLVKIKQRKRRRKNNKKKPQSPDKRPIIANIQKLKGKGLLNPCAWITILCIWAL